VFPPIKTRRLFQRPLLFAAETTGALVVPTPTRAFFFCVYLVSLPAIMKTLFLLRHAKAENAAPGSSDFDRALQERGKRDARALGVFVGELNLKFDQVLCSNALRARETAELVLAAAALQSKLYLDERIYEAPPSRLLEVLREIRNDRTTVLVVGHNPGMEELLQLLTHRVEPMATCAFAKIDLDADQWGEVGDIPGSLDWIVKPETLNAG
jgi:phosphohistidine phosphatase